MGVFVFAGSLAEAANDALFSKLSSQIDANTDISDSMKTFVKNNLFPLCTNPVFVAETKKQNSKKMPLDEIKAIDQQWMKAESQLPIQKEKLNNVCAREIKRIVKDLGVLAETFVMDNQGGLVGENELTSDYWQGDEDKWTKSFSDGNGGVDISKKKLDKSTGVVDQKISLPIIDESGKVIGAICIGVKPDKI